MKIKETEAAIEAILFAMGGSVELPRIARAIGVDEKTTGIQSGQGAGASGCPRTSDPARDHGRVSALLRRTGSGIPACP